MASQGSRLLVLSCWLGCQGWARFWHFSVAQGEGWGWEKRVTSCISVSSDFSPKQRGGGWWYKLSLHFQQKFIFLGNCNFWKICQSQKKKNPPYLKQSFVNSLIVISPKDVPPSCSPSLHLSFLSYSSVLPNLIKSLGKGEIRVWRKHCTSVNSIIDQGYEE